MGFNAVKLDIISMKISFKKRGNLKRTILGVFIIFALIFLLNFFQKEVRSFFYLISSPIQKVFWQVGDRVSGFFGGFLQIKKLTNEIDELELKNQELFAEITALKELKKENQILRGALDVELQKDFKLMTARVIGKDISQDYLLIDRGSNDNIAKTMPVITQQKILLGRISEVYKNFSKVMLISDKESSFDGEIQGKDISGIVKGRGNFKLIFDLIPREKEISQGDIVISTSLGGIFPAGILVGQVENVEKSDVEPFQFVEIKPAFDINKINTLFLITAY